MKLSKKTKMITRSAIESYYTKDINTQKQLIEKWQKDYKDKKEGYSPHGLVALKLILRVLKT